jgi:hypothetical protein
LLWFFVSHDAVINYRGDFAILIGILIALSSLVARLARIGRSLMTPDAAALLQHDHRPPVIYLRPFEEDLRQISGDPEGERIGGIGVKHAPHWRASREEEIAPSLRSVGPFIAVGKPGDRLAPLGAARLYLRDEEWHEKVAKLVSAAAAVIIQPEASPGAKWELGIVARAVDPRRVLMLVPNPTTRPSGYKRIQTLANNILGVTLPDVASADAFIFDAQGTPVPLLLDQNTADGRENLRKFLEQIQAVSTRSTLPRAAFVQPRPADDAEFSANAGVPQLDGFVPGYHDAFPTGQPSGIGCAGAGRCTSFVDWLHRKSNLARLPADLLQIASVAFCLAFVWAMTLGKSRTVGPAEVILTGVVSLVAAGWIGYVLENLAHRLSLRGHPLGRALAAFGEIEAVRADVDADFVGKFDPLPLHIGSRWLCYGSAKQAMVQHLDSVVWAYFEEVHISRSDYKEKWQLVLWMRNGVAYVLPMRKREAEEAITGLERAAPWINLGYSENLKDAWNLDRYDFIEKVDHRRAHCDFEKDAGAHPVVSL